MSRSRLVSRAAVTATLTVVAGLAAVAPASGASAAEITDGLVLRYGLDGAVGTVVEDSSGRGRHGVLNGVADWTGGEGLGFNGTDTSVKLPDDVLAGMASITVGLEVFVDPAQPGPYFIYGLGNTTAGAGDGYLFTTGNDYRTAIATGNWSTEQNTRPAVGHNLARGTWKHLAYTLTDGTAVLYEDGVEVGRNAAVTIRPGDLGNGTTTANYLGRSVYANDRLFLGRMRDFRIYDRALGAEEVGRLGLRAAISSVALDRAELTLGETMGVTANLPLPRSGRNGSVITWTSSDPSVVAPDGTVQRPALGRPDARITLTANLALGEARESKVFPVTVLAEFNDSQMVNRAAAALRVHKPSDVRGNLHLPTTGPDGTTVTWLSDRPSVISPSGVVQRPAAGAGSVTVVLHAKVSLNGAEATRTFTTTVRELPERQDLTGYLFSYFTGEGTANGEQVYFALSQGNDPLHWRELNGGRPTLTSTLGEEGLRDPFIIRSPEGDKFYQIATDLKINGNWDWNAAQRTGSRAIMVWESTDLVNWTDQRLVTVSPESAGNTWAPEAYYDRTLGAYVVFWASRLYDNAAHTGPSYNRMMYATTRDFVTFSEPQVWIDPGHDVIDSTVIEHGGTYYRFTKDERDNTPATPCGKFPMVEKSTTLLNPAWELIAECLGMGTISHGEGPAVVKSNTEEKWYLFIDEHGGRGYVPFESTDLDSGTWTPSTDYVLPPSPRHGTVLPVTRAEYDRLLLTYGAD